MSNQSTFHSSSPQWCTSVPVYLGIHSQLKLQFALFGLNELSCCCRMSSEVTVAVDDKEKAKHTRVLLDALLAKGSPRFEASRKASLDVVRTGLDGVYQNISNAIHNKYYFQLVQFMNSMVDFMGGTNTDAPEQAQAHLAILTDAFTVPFKDLDFQSFMDSAKFEVLSTWYQKHSAWVPVFKDFLTVLLAKERNIGDSAIPNFFAVQLQAFEGHDVDSDLDFENKFTSFRSAAAARVKELCSQKVAETFPREFAPIAEVAAKTKSVPGWEDLFNTQVADAMGGSITADGIVAHRAIADNILAVWKVLPNVGMWQVEVQKNGGSKQKPQVVPIKLGMDILIVTIHVAATYFEFIPITKCVAEASLWKAKVVVDLRPALIKTILAGLERAKCVREAVMSQLGQFVANLSPVSVVPDASSKVCMEPKLLVDAFKALDNKNVVRLVSSINDIIKYAVDGFRTIFTKFAQNKECDLLDLENLADEGRKLDKAAIEKNVRAGVGPDAKQLYTDFRFWNENLVDVLAFAKELAHEGLNISDWDSNDVVKKAGRICGSITLMQGLNAPDETKVNVLTKTMKGLSMLGRGLMDGHAIVQARANEILAAAAAKEAEAPPPKKKKS